MSARIVGRPLPIAPNPVRKRRPDAPELIAYRVSNEHMKIVPATHVRAWMDKLPEQFVKRCLPLLMASQWGWFLLNPVKFTATWNGGIGLGDITISNPGGAISHFGSGILTWNVPYLFRTSPGYNLWVRGPTNWPKDAIQALEGVVETDWPYSTFTMNYAFTCEDEPVTFEQDEPFCMILPQRRGELESFTPKIVNAPPDVMIKHQRWSNSRLKFNADLKVPGSEATKQHWQREYFLGKQSDGTKFPEHQTRLSLKPFVESQT